MSKILEILDFIVLKISGYELAPLIRSFEKTGSILLFEFGVCDLLELVVTSDIELTV